MLWDAAEGDVDPVREDDCPAGSLIGDTAEGVVEARALSFPVTASEIALNPMRGFENDFEGPTADLGEPFELLGFVEEVTIFMLGFISYSSLVTVGDVRLVDGVVCEKASPAEELRKWPMPPWYILAAGEAMAATVSLIESTLPNRE